MATEVTISSKNQIVLPREAREALGVKPGDKLLVVVHGNGVMAIEKPESTLARIQELVKDVYPEGYLEQERESWS